MLQHFMTLVVDACRRFAVFVGLFALIMTVGLSVYVIGHLSINTDINQLLSADLPWRKQEKALESAFPHKTDNLVILVDGNNGDRTDAAAQALAARLQTNPDLFTYVARPDALPFFRTNGLLYLSVEEIGAILDQIVQAQPMLGTIAADPSLRGLFGMVGLMTQGLQAGAAEPTQIAAAMTAITRSLNAARLGSVEPIDWADLNGGAKNQNQGDLRSLRKYILTKPVLNYSSLTPGEQASDFIRATAKDLGLEQQGIKVRLTGTVALNDEEFASVEEGMGGATILSGLLVFGLLFAAMRSWRIVLPITLTLICGLVATTAFATFTVGSLNLISVAFAVMFIGIAVDFGIQFGVRYRDQHVQEENHAAALRRTAHVIAIPLAMAAGSTALGFLAFIPTAYRGVSELGLIAGAGMVIAFTLNLTLLPALMTLFRPGAESEGIGYSTLSPLNSFLLAHKDRLRLVFAAVAIVAVAGASQVKFNFDPLDIKDPKTESVAAMFDAMNDPDSDAYAAQMLVNNDEDARTLAARLEKLPQVSQVRWLASFVPEDQDKKLPLIEDAATLLAPTLTLEQLPPPSTEETRTALTNAVSALRAVAVQLPQAGALADAVSALAEDQSPEALNRATEALVAPMQAKLEDVRKILSAKPVTMADIPDDLRRDWVAADGKWLVEALPRRTADHNPRDPKMLAAFVAAVRTVAPDAAGTPVSIQESGNTIVTAFIQAGLYGLGSICLLSFLILRRVRLVFLMLLPLFMAGSLTLATLAAIGLPLNFANIIALPLLLSLGVSYGVYFVTHQGHDYLQSGMARAVLFSAATVLVAFCSLSFSSHPGTSGMGDLLTISLLYSLASTFLMLPVLLSSDNKSSTQP